MKIKGYQKGGLDALKQSASLVNSSYVDGISVTLVGSPRPRKLGMPWYRIFYVICHG